MTHKELLAKVGFDNMIPVIERMYPLEYPHLHEYREKYDIILDTIAHDSVKHIRAYTYVKDLNCYLDSSNLSFDCSYEDIVGDVVETQCEIPSEVELATYILHEMCTQCWSENMNTPRNKYVSLYADAFTNNPFRKESERLRSLIIKRGYAWPLYAWFNANNKVMRRKELRPKGTRQLRPFSLKPKMNGPKRKWFKRKIRRLSTIEELSARWQALQIAYLATSHPCCRALQSMFVQGAPWEVRALKVERFCLRRPESDETGTICEWLTKYWRVPKDGFNHCELVINTKERVEMDRLRSLGILPQGYMNLMHSSQYRDINSEWIEGYFIYIDAIYVTGLQHGLESERRRWCKLGYCDYMKFIDKQRRQR